MATTSSATFSNVAFSPVIAPSKCTSIEVRESPTVSTPQAYTVVAPGIFSPANHRFAGEATSFTPETNLYFLAGDISGYIKTSNGSTTFELFCTN